MLTTVEVAHEENRTRVDGSSSGGAHHLLQPLHLSFSLLQRVSQAQVALVKVHMGSHAVAIVLQLRVDRSNNFQKLATKTPTNMPTHAGALNGVFNFFVKNLFKQK